ncbi:MAG: trigger factor [Bacteroidales bacterium]|nr:trigger factor [Candidatus Colicola faecequi]
MQITKTDIDQLNAKLTLVVEPVDYEEKVAKELRNIRQKASIPGFRPGKVPASLIQKQYGKAVLAEELNKAIGELLYGYIQENNLNILGEPLANDEETPDLDFENQTSFTFVFDIAVAPEFNCKLNGNNKLTHYDVQVTDEMVENQVKGYAERFGQYLDAEAAEEGDMLRGTLVENAENGKTVENQVLTPAYMTPAQKKKFAGAKVGDVVVFNPKKAFKDNEAELTSLLKVTKEELADIKDEFSFTLTGITRHQAAEINADLFAKVYGEGNVKDEADFRDKVKAEIKANFDQDAEYKFGLDCKAAVMKKMEKIAFPEEFLKRWLLTANKELTMEEVEKDWTKTLDQLRWQLAKDQLAEQFEVKVDAADVKAYAKEIAKMQFMQYGMSHVEDQYLESFATDMLKDENQARGIYDRVQENKIYEALKSVVKLETKEISHEDFGKLFA